MSDALQTSSPREASTIVDVILRNAAWRPRAPWLVDPWEPDLNVSYQRLAELCAGAADALRRLGIRAGDCVALSIENGLDFYLAWFGANWLGAAVVPLNLALTVREATYIVEHSGATSWIVGDDSQIQETARTTLSNLAGAQRLIQSACLREGSRDEGLAPVDVSPDTLATILYTSGTTGEPKGCRCPHSYYVATGTRFTNLIAATPDDRFATSLPLFHMNAQTMATMGSLVSGASLFVEKRFHATGFMRRLAVAQATVFSYIGSIPAILVAQPTSPDDRNHRIRLAFGGGISPSIHAEAEARFGIPWVEGYGMTEVGMCIGCRYDAVRKVGTACCGTPLSGVEARLIEPGGIALTGEGEGELEVRGAGLFSGYHKMKLGDAFQPGGWFRTGDTIRRDEDGMYYFVDRSRDIIRRSGENISAREIESVLDVHVFVRESAVVGVADAVRGQDVCAYVVLADGVASSEDTERLIREYAQRNLAYFKVPRYIQFVDSLPRTATQRIRKHLLREKDVTVSESNTRLRTRPCG